MATGRARRFSRRGVILFLEFMATLPIFALLILAATAFHIYYKHTRTAFGEAKAGAWTRLDDHFTSYSARLPDFRDQQHKTRDQRSDDNSPKVDDKIAVHNYDGVVQRELWKGQQFLPSWMYTSDPKEHYAIGFYYGNRDCWAHYDTRVRIDDGDKKKVESMPWFFFNSKASDQLAKDFLHL